MQKFGYCWLGGYSADSLTPITLIDKESERTGRSNESPAFTRLTGSGRPHRITYRLPGCVSRMTPLRIDTKLLQVRWSAPLTGRLI